MTRWLRFALALLTATATMAVAAPAATALPQWGVDTFLVAEENADPIVAPSVFPFGHKHDATGNAAFSAFMTTAQIWLSSTNSSDPLDKSSRWVPALVNDATGASAPFIKIHVYYRNPSFAPRLQLLPQGDRVIAGDSHATQYQSANIISWQCSTGGGFVVPPQSCGGGKLQLLIKYPNCWNGSALDSPDHKSHMAYMNATTKQCPADHPVMVPQIQQVVSWNIDGIAGYHLSSDDSNQDGIADVPAGASAHGDNLFFWDTPEQMALINDCLVGATARDCGNITAART